MTCVRHGGRGLRCVRIVSRLVQAPSRPLRWEPLSEWWRPWPITSTIRPCSSPGVVPCDALPLGVQVRGVQVVADAVCARGGAGT